jgi:signal recognition particle subunit SRP54
MFEAIASKLQKIFKDLHGEGHLTEAHIDKGLKEIRLALLEADVHYKVVKGLVDRIAAKAKGAEVMQSLTPAQQLVKIVRDELTAILGETPRPLNVKGNPSVFLLVGLQGSGKTTTAVKLALRLRKEGKRAVLAPADTRRPAAMEQLVVLAKGANLPHYTMPQETNPRAIVQKALDLARSEAYDVLIVDSAGRLHIDEELMRELRDMAAMAKPAETLFIADAMIGQDAVKAATQFHEGVPLTGIILTKMDGDSRGGAALSIKEVLGIPVRYLGTGEKVGDLEPFDPARVAGRILGMGDVLALIEKAEVAVEAEEAEAMAEKLRRNDFTMDDLLKQIKMVRRMGPITDLLKHLPMGGPFKKLADMEVDDGVFTRTAAIIQSMTLDERERPHILNASRKKRVAKGSGTSVQAVNQLLKQYAQMQKMIKEMGRRKMF